ncbi:MAG: hypothetical protein HFF60_06550, partial [Oscillospiraceae bacterium]|nr:hypothetical protein [Oscillospiraceae bacterium]
MKFWRNLSRRGLSMFLALVMCISLLQVTAFAEESDSLEPAPSISESTQAEESTGSSAPDVDVDTDTDVDVDTGTDVNVDTDTDADVDTDTDAGVDTDTDVDVDTDTDVDVDTDTDADVDTDTDVDVNTDTDVDVDTDTDVDADTDADVDVDTDTDIDVDTNTDVDVDTDTKPSTPNYATKDELEAAFDAVSATDDVDDALAAVDAYLAIYDRLSPEDQKANADALAYAKAYRESLLESLEGELNPEIEPLAMDTVRVNLTVYIWDSFTGYGSKTPSQFGLKAKSSLPTSNVKLNNAWPLTTTDATWSGGANRFTATWTTERGSASGTLTFLTPDELFSNIESYSGYKYAKTYGSNYNSSTTIGNPYQLPAGAQGVSVYLMLYGVKLKDNGGAPNPGDPTIPSGPYVTIFHEYYTNGKFDGRSDPEYQSVTAPNYNVPKNILQSDIKSREPNYNGNTYKYRSMSSDPSPVKVPMGATGNQGTFTVRYERTVSNDPETKLGNFTVKKSFDGLAGGVDTPQVELTYEVYRTKDNQRVGELQQGKVNLAKQPNGTYTGTITPTVWDILTGEGGMSDDESERYKNVVIITEDLDSAKVDGYSLQFGPVYPADGFGSGASVTFEMPGVTYQKTLAVKNTYSIEVPKTITVTWLDGYTDTPIKVETIDPDGDYSKLYPNDPTRDGYYFTGWGEPETDKDGNITITAQWKELTYKVEWY